MGFRPRFAIGLFYFFVFFMLAGLLMILPELLDVLERVPPGPEQQEAAKEVARNAMGGKLGLAFLAALGATALGAYFEVLPGLAARE